MHFELHIFDLPPNNCDWHLSVSVKSVTKWGEWSFLIKKNKLVILNNVWNVTKRENRGDAYIQIYCQYFMYKIFSLFHIFSSIMLSYTYLSTIYLSFIYMYSYTSFLHISFQERRKMKIFFFKQATMCVCACFFVSLSPSLSIWDFWTALVSPCVTWRQRSFKTWTNWRVPRQVSELVVNGALGCKWRILALTRE